jgi:DNA-binding NtrC family response regulator
VVPVRLPPLRERREDIPLLVQHFIETESARLGREVRPIDQAALDALCAYDWPGNVRELRNVIERAVVMSPGGVIVLAAELGARRGATAAAARTAAAVAEPCDFGARGSARLARRGTRPARGAARAHRQSLSRMLRELGLRPGGAAPGGGGELGPG